MGLGGVRVCAFYEDMIKEGISAIPEPDTQAAGVYGDFQRASKYILRCTRQRMCCIAARQCYGGSTPFHLVRKSRVNIHSLDDGCDYSDSAHVHGRTSSPH